MAVALKDPPQFEPGQQLRITDGPFKDFVGRVTNVYSEFKKLRMVISFFGRDTPVEMDFLQVEKA